MSLDRSRKVLIAEEDRMVADLLKLALEEMGCQVQIATKKHIILEGVLRWKPDLLLLDLFLPGCSGLDLLREFQVLQNGPGKALPILVISSLGFKEVVEQAILLGATDFLLKPIDLDVFRQKTLMYLP